MSIVINKIKYSKDALNVFSEQIRKFGLVETGGILLGYSKNNMIFVEKASSPGPKAMHDGLSFKADPVYQDMIIDIEHANSGGKIKYLGEWHTHPQIFPEPSELDLLSLEEISSTCEVFSMLLIIGPIDYNESLFQQQSINILKYRKLSNFLILENI